MAVVAIDTRRDFTNRRDVTNYVLTPYERQLVEQCDKYGLQAVYGRCCSNRGRKVVERALYKRAMLERQVRKGLIYG